MHDLFDEQAVEQTWMTIKEHIGNLLISFNGTSSTETMESSNDTLAARAEALYDQTIDLIDQMQKTIAVSLGVSPSGNLDAM